ncbi:MAG: TetR/AcrR family transcriptional regulator [Myxococcota bacterium]
MTGLRERQKQGREARILAAAAELFETQGYGGTAIQEIAGRAELAVGTIYNYFRSKPEIVLAIVRRDTAEALAAGEEVLKHPPRDPVGAVTALLERAIEPFARHDRALWRELVAAALLDPKLAAGLFAEDLRLVGELSALLRELQARGDLRPELDAGRAAVALYGVFFSWFMAFVASDAVAIGAVRAELAQGIGLVMHGLLARAPSEARRAT